MSAANKRWRGIPLGCHRIWGVDIPNEFADKMRDYAGIIARLMGSEKATSFLVSAMADDWDVDRPTFTQRETRDWSLYRELIAEGMSREEVAKFANVSEWYLNRGVLDHRKGKIRDCF